MPLSPLSRTLLRSLLRLSRKPLPRNLQLMDHPLPMPPSIDRIVSSKALRNAIMLCFRNGPDTPSNSDSAFFCLRQLLREHDYAKELLDKAEKRTKLSYIYKKTFELGDVVLHKHTGVRGVVMGWDFDSDGAQLLYLLFDKYDANRHEAVVVKKKSKRPNFQNMSPDWLSNMRLAASYSLVTDPLLQRVHHDSIPDKFSSFDAVSDRFVPKFDWQLRYPEDVKHVSMQPLEVGVDDAKGSDAVAVQMRKSSSIANVRLSLDSLYAALDKILHEAMSKSTYGAGAGFSADPGQPGSELGMLLYLDAFCHSVCAPGSHESQNSFLRDRFRDILRRSDKTLSGKNNDISASADPRIRALEEELVQELSKWKQDNERPSKRVECYNQMHQLNILYESLLDMLLKRFDNRSDLIDALNSIRDASGSSLLQSNKDVNSMDQSLCENMNKLLAQENRIGDEMLMPGDIVFDSQHESYGVCVERDRRAQFVLNVPRPSRRMAEDVWMV